MTIATTELEELYRKYGSMVHSRALRLLKNEHEALDAMQDTFVNVVQHWATFRHESSPSTWLYRIVTRLCLNRIRDRKPHDESAVHALTQRSHLHSVVDRIDVLRILKQIPEELREVAVYHYVDGLDPKEIADLIQKSRRTVSYRLEQFRTRAKLILDSSAEGFK